MRGVLTAKVIDRTKTMANVYRAFYDFSSMLKSKVDVNDPNAKTTSIRIVAAQRICKDYGILSNRRYYIVKREPSDSPALIALVFIILAILYAYLSANRTNKFKVTL